MMIPMSVRPVAPLLVAGLCLMIAACASQPPPAQPVVPPLTSASPAQMLELIRAAAGDGEGELAVQPLRDPMVEDLRGQAEHHMANGDADAAAGALDQALAIVADDPALLQERAEVAVL